MAGDDIELTASDLELLRFAGEHRFVVSAHVRALLRLTADAADGRLGELCDAGLIAERTVFAGFPATYRSTRKGLDAVASSLRAPTIDVGRYDHEVGAAWLWLAARNGAFGPMREVIGERRLRSRDGSAADHPGSPSRSQSVSAMSAATGVRAAAPPRPAAGRSGRTAARGRARADLEGTRRAASGSCRAMPRIAGSPGSCTSSRARGWPSRSARPPGGWASRISSTCSECGGRPTRRAPPLEREPAGTAERGAARAGRRVRVGWPPQERSCDAAVGASRHGRDDGRTGCCSCSRRWRWRLRVGRSPGAALGLVAATIGGARLVGASRVHAAARDAAADGVALGVDGDGRPVVLSDRQLSAHALIVGASGAGKSTTLLTILTDHIRRGRPVVAIDMKGSPAFAGELARAAGAAGRPFQLWSLDGPSHWNPLAHGNPTELKDKLIGTERFTEPHYQRAAERYVQTVLQVLEQLHPGRPPALEEVVRMMDHRRLPSIVRELPEPLAERITGYLGGLTGDQVSAIRGLGTRLAVLTESHSAPFLAPPQARSPNAPAPEVDLHRALSGGEVVLLSLNSGKYGKLAAQLGTLAVQDLVCAAGERLASGGPPGRPQAIVGIDEFSALGSDHVVR